MPDPLNGSPSPSPASGTSGGSAPSAAPAPSPSPAPAPAPSAIPADAGAAAAGSATASDYVGIRDASRQLGLDLSGHFQDDQAALAYLVNAARQAQQLQQIAPYAQQYAQHAERFQGWLREQQEAERQRQAQQQRWWRAPEFDPNWRQKLTRDPVTNEIRAVPGADPSLVAKYHAAEEHRQSFLEKFAFDPIGTIRPGIEEIVQQVAQQMVQQHLGGYQDQSFATSFVANNSQWLHAHDQQGQLMRDGYGRPVLSPVGQRFAAYVSQAERLGIADIRAQQSYATQLVQADLARAYLQGGGAAPAAASPREAANAAYLAAHNRPNQSGSQPASHAPGGGPAQNPRLSLAEMLRQDLAAAGVTDRDIAAPALR